MRSIPIPPTTTTNTLATTSSTVVAATTTNTTSVASPWHSPVPYLFGGLAVIMVLIALALLMLACSYSRLTRITQQESNNNTTTTTNNNNVAKEGDDDSEKKEQPKVYEEKILVIMAGDHKPTFLATPSSSLGCSNFDHKHLGNSEDSDKSQKEIIVDDHHVVVSDAEHENGSFRHEQRSQ